MKKVRLIVVCLLLSIAAFAQQTIRGIVYDELYDPLPGCFVLLERTKTAAITGLDGRFTLTIPTGNYHYLLVSHIGYATTIIKVIDSHTLHVVTMRDINNCFATYDLKKKPIAIHEIDPYTVRDIRGRLLYEHSTDGSVRPIQYRKIKNLNKGTDVETDAEGYFYLKAVSNADRLEDVPTGSIFLVGNVTDSVLYEYPEPVFSRLTVSGTDTLGVLYMNDDMPENSYRHVANPHKIKKIKKQPGGGFFISEDYGSDVKRGQEICFTSYIDVGTAGKLPDRGIDAGGYNPKDFFRTGVSFGNFLNAGFGAFKSSVISLKLGQNRNNSTIPHAYKEVYNVSLVMKNIRVGTFQSEVGVMFKSAYGKLIQQEANLSSLLYSVLTAPAASGNTGNPDNNLPGRMINELPDRNKNDDLLTYLKVKKKFYRVDASAMLSYDKQWDKQHSGTLNNAVLPYRLSYRNFNSSNAMAQTDMNWLIKGGRIMINGLLSHGFKHTEEKIYRNDQYEHTGVLQHREQNKQIRNAHDIKYGIKLNNTRRDVRLEIFNKHYFSNTAKQADYVNLFPELAFLWDTEPFIRKTFLKGSHRILLYAFAGRSAGESSLIYRNPAILSTVWNAADFRNYSEYTEMYNYKGLKPETYLKSEIGVRYFPRNKKFSGEANVFYNHTHNYIAPVMGNNQTPVLNNVGRLRNYGYSLSGRYKRDRYAGYVAMDILLNFSQTRSKVSAVYGDRTFVPMAGFSDIQTVFAKNQPLGAIYGMVDNTLQKIGDPTPDFIVTLNPKLWRRNFGFSFVLEYNHGGDRWNGTRAMLDQSLSSPGQSTGTGREYIQDASFLRLSNIMLSYSVFKNRNHPFFKSMKINAQAQNLFVLSPYKGVDPSSLLFGYASGHGLDMFNLPSTRSYTLSLTFQF